MGWCLALPVSTSIRVSVSGLQKLDQLYCHSLVQEVSQHLRPFWVFPLDVRLMIILWCNLVYLQRINRVCFPEPEEGPAAASNIFAQNPWPALPESFLLKGSSALCFLHGSAVSTHSALSRLLYLLTHGFCGLYLHCLYTSCCLHQGRQGSHVPQVHRPCSPGRPELPRVSLLHKNSVNLNKLGQWHHDMAMPSHPRHRYDRAALGVCTLADCPSQTLS